MVLGSQNIVGVAAAKMQFFDRQVFGAYEKAEKRALSKFGSFVRSDARKSMKPAGKKGAPSPPGKPPKAIEGQLKRFLFFLYDRNQSNVIIGPIKLSNKSRQGMPIPGLHEHGGFVPRPKRGKRRAHVARYPARPYMQPAGDKNLAKLPELWKDAIR